MYKLLFKGNVTSVDFQNMLNCYLLLISEYCLTISFYLQALCVPWGAVSALSPIGLVETQQQKKKHIIEYIIPLLIIPVYLRDNY